MRELDTIQTSDKLNSVFAQDEAGTGNANHVYEVYTASGDELIATIKFQHGPRRVPESISGVLDTDLLEIVRDRLKSFQSGEFACRENAIALTHIEDALLWMDRRVRDRAKRGVLGTNQK